MSVVSVAEIHDGQGAQEKDGVITCVRVYNVTISEPSSTGGLEALQAGGVPERGDKYPLKPDNKGTPICVGKSAVVADSTRRMYRVSVEYTNEARRVEINTQEDPDVAPWDRDPQHTYDVREYSEPLLVDRSATPLPVVNAAGEPFSPPQEVEAVYPTITVSRASLAYNQTTAQGLIGSVNSAEVTINGHAYAAGTVRLLKWAGVESEWIDNGTGDQQTYYDERIELEVHPAGFDLQVVNQGYHVLTPEGIPSRIVFADGQPPAVPQYLAADGKSITGTPNYLTFRPYAWADWTALGLG